MKAQPQQNLLAGVFVGVGGSSLDHSMSLTSCSASTAFSGEKPSAWQHTDVEVRSMSLTSEDAVGLSMTVKSVLADAQKVSSKGGSHVGACRWKDHLQCDGVDGLLGRFGGDASGGG